ncbi:MAG: hypothetical protein ACOX8X_02675 [Methanomethylophilus sp.]|jgi:hypothetical protein
MSRPISDIRIADVDTSLASEGARVLSIKTGSHSFQTPTRPFTTAEITAKSFLGYKGEIVNDIAAIPIDFSGKRKELFLGNSKAISKAEASLRSNLDAAYGKPELAVFQMDPLEASDIKSLKVAFDMQRDAEGLDIITLPETGPDIKSFSEAVSKWCEGAETADKGAAVQLSLKEDVEVFSSKLSLVSELSRSGSIQAINIRYERPEKCRLQLAELWKARESINAIVNCTQFRSAGSSVSVPGIESKVLLRDAETDLLQHGFDMVTPVKKTVSSRFIARMNNQPAPDSLDKIDLFNMAVHEAGVSIKSNAWMKMGHPPECRCSVCRGREKDALISAFSYKDNREIERSGMRYFSILHSHQSDMNELEILRRYAKSEGAKEYNNRQNEKMKEVKTAIGKGFETS